MSDSRLAGLRLRTPRLERGAFRSPVPVDIEGLDELRSFLGIDRLVSMGIKELFQRWTKGEDARAVERAEEESRMTPAERDGDREDFEARKDDLVAGRGPAGDAALDAAADDLEP